jgi:hypothetical protein
MPVSTFGRSNARTCIANPGAERIPAPGLSILKVSLLEALTELTYRLQNPNCRGRPGIESLPSGQGDLKLCFFTANLLHLKEKKFSCFKVTACSIKRLSCNMFILLFFGLGKEYLCKIEGAFS